MIPAAVVDITETADRVVHVTAQSMILFWVYSGVGISIGYTFFRFTKWFCDTTGTVAKWFWDGLVGWVTSLADYLKAVSK